MATPGQGRDIGTHWSNIRVRVGLYGVILGLEYWGYMRVIRLGLH